MCMSKCGSVEFFQLVEHLSIVSFKDYGILHVYHRDLMFPDFQAMYVEHWQLVQNSK